MDIGKIAQLIYDYTSGYPFLVSRLCQLIDENVSKSARSLSAAWTKQGVEEAVRMILSEDNTLFRSVTAKLQNYPELKASLHDVLMEGSKLSYKVLFEGRV